MRILMRRIFVTLAVPLAAAGCGGTSAPTAAEGAPTSLASTPAQKAAMELGSAQTLERSRKTKQAVAAYRRIVQEYPDSPQATIAAEHLKTLGSK
jgi:TolA-binding protein